MFPLFLLQLSFEDFFGEQTYYYIRNNGNRIIETPEQYVFVENCAFYSLSSLNGGAIYLSSTTGNLYVTTSLFNNCSATDSYGAVYYQVINSGVVFDKTCAYHCYSSYGLEKFGQFGIGYVNSNNYNAFQLVSIALCSPFSAHSSCAFRFYGGKQMCLNSNSSKNKVYRHSGIDFTEGNTYQAKYITLSDNVVGGWTALMVYGINGNIDYCNFCRNNSPDSRGVFIFGASDTRMSNCVFLNNMDVLFDSRADCSYFGIINCFIDNYNYINSAPYTSNIASFITQTLPLTHYQSADCYAQIKFLINTNKLADHHSVSSFILTLFIL